MDRIEQIKQAVVDGRHNDIEAMVQQAVDDGMDPDRIVRDALIGGMDIVGEKFAEGQFYVPEMFVAAAAMKKGLVLLRPLLGRDGVPSRGKVLMGTVKGDIHDIGKNLVIIMLEGAGFEVVDLGVDLGVKKIVSQVSKLRPRILGLSALLTTTIPEMPKVIKALEEKGVRKDVKVMVGGAPVDAEFATRIGADGYARDATEAVQLARMLSVED